MDIDDLDVQSNTIMESTLESEIDALSKIIDTTDSRQKLKNDVKLDSDIICSNVSNSSKKSTNSDLTYNKLIFKDVLDICEETENSISLSAQENNDFDPWPKQKEEDNDFKMSDELVQDLQKNKEIHIDKLSNRIKKFDDILNPLHYLNKDEKTKTENMSKSNIECVPELFDQKQNQNDLKNELISVSAKLFEKNVKTIEQNDEIYSNNLSKLITIQNFQENAKLNDCKYSENVKKLNNSDEEIKSDYNLNDTLTKVGSIHKDGLNNMRQKINVVEIDSALKSKPHKCHGINLETSIKDLSNDSKSNLKNVSDKNNKIIPDFLDMKKFNDHKFEIINKNKVPRNIEIKNVDDFDVEEMKNSIASDSKILLDVETKNNMQESIDNIILIKTNTEEDKTQTKNLEKEIDKANDLQTNIEKGAEVNGNKLEIFKNQGLNSLEPYSTFSHKDKLLETEKNDNEECKSSIKTYQFIESIKTDDEKFTTTEKKEKMKFIIQEFRLSSEITEVDNIDNKFVSDDEVKSDNILVDIKMCTNKKKVAKKEIDKINEELKTSLETKKYVPFEIVKSFLDEDKDDINKTKSSDVLNFESSAECLQVLQKKEVMSDIVIDETPDIFFSEEDNVDNENIVLDLPGTAFDPIVISEDKAVSKATEKYIKCKEEINKQNSLVISSELNKTEVIRILSANIDSPIAEVTSEQVSSSNNNESNLLSETLILHKQYQETLSNKDLDVQQLISATRNRLLFQNDHEQHSKSSDIHNYNDSKISGTNKKENFNKQPQIPDCESLGSPRIILKIAKSAIAECSETRSLKCSKIRSSANSPILEENLSHKLGKIKLKLSKDGHPSIITSNDSHEEMSQPQMDNTLSEKSLGVKIKLTKSLELEGKHEEIQKQEEVKEEDRKTEALKIKLSRTGDASIVQSETMQESKNKDNGEFFQDTSTVKKQELLSIGMKIKLSKTGDATIIPQESKNQSVYNLENEDINEYTKRSEPIGMKIKFFKSGDASIIPKEPSVKIDDAIKRTDSPIGVKIKLARTKDGRPSIVTNDAIEELKEKTDIYEVSKKIKQLKTNEAFGEICEGKEKSEIHVSELPEENITKIFKISTKNDITSDPADKKTLSIDAIPSIGMKIKLSKTGDPSIIHPLSKEFEDISQTMKGKHSKYSTLSQQTSKDDSQLEMKFEMSKTGFPIIIKSNENEKDFITNVHDPRHCEYKNILSFKESTLEVLKKTHLDMIVEPFKNRTEEKLITNFHVKRKEVTMAPIEAKNSRLETNFASKQMLPDVTIQPVTSLANKEQKLTLLDDNNGQDISQQQMNVINHEISITQVCSSAKTEVLPNDEHKTLVHVKNVQLSLSPLNSDCEIIEAQPEFIIVNENSNSSQDVMIIDEVPSTTTVKIPKRRGRPRRQDNSLRKLSTSPNFHEFNLQKDPLSLDQPCLQQSVQIQDSDTSVTLEGSLRPRRTCRSQKSYAPPKRGRGRGRGKRKNEALDISIKKSRIEQDLTEIEKSTTAVITLEKLPIGTPCPKTNSPELFKVFNQSMHKLNTRIEKIEPIKIKSNLETIFEPEEVIEISLLRVEKNQLKDQNEVKKTKLEIKQEEKQNFQKIIEKSITLDATKKIEESAVDKGAIPSISSMLNEETDKTIIQDKEKTIINKSDIVMIKMIEKGENLSKLGDKNIESIKAIGGSTIHQQNQNWLAPSVPKNFHDPSRIESISTLTVIDEDTRMSAEFGPRSQTPARNVTTQGITETFVNEESQGSVHSSATTESEKVKVQKNRRMEINFDPDEGPFTVDKIAEYEWPKNGKEERFVIQGETFMIQEQISHYLGVKSFKRKYPDLKRRIVDMEERNFLRENGLVSESMCDMGLTAVSSSEVLDIMCSDFPEQYEEYRKYLREKAAKEHSKKQKELTAAANAERNRIDLAEMAIQSALNWNVNFNKARQDLRNSSLDLQTFTIQVPKQIRKNKTTKRGNFYPVTVIPGQFTDYFREYTPAELRYFPLNTVLYGPMRPNERKFDNHSEASQSDSDSDSSSDESCSSSSGGTDDTEGSQLTNNEIKIKADLKIDTKCKICQNFLNKNNRSEVLIQCRTCNENIHPSCIDLTIDMVPHIRAYAWQCTDCKTCAQCHDPADEDKMLFCDMCDRGYHIYCVGLRRVPQGRWHCQECAVCTSCGSKEADFVNSEKNSIIHWQHEYRKSDKNTRVYVSTFCTTCSKFRETQGIDN